MNLALYISFFGFSAAPFAKEIGDADLWLPPSKQDTVDGLCEAALEFNLLPRRIAAKRSMKAYRRTRRRLAATVMQIAFLAPRQLRSTGHRLPTHTPVPSRGEPCRGERGRRGRV